jgi:ribonuclease HI
MFGTLHFDGGGQAPGPISGGTVIERPGYDDDEDSFKITEGTHNQGEYHALNHGLTRALQLGVTHLTAYGDSKLVVEQVGGRFRCKNAGLEPLLATAHGLLSRFESCELTHIPREENARADALSTAALKGRP